ncbi:leucine-rich repeat-containing G-protein coupled receptor 4-like, partial [Ruditapes philippinarum]|uniref:leucine-rich repeat-containing G-protein coupled receptor 4-like n=1 Tax=Ruditapes philippinarum TaxID=129788 RepID=UPI00295B70CD
IFSFAALVSCCDSFLLGDSCLAPAPCTCSGSGSSYAYIHCESKSLNATPHFQKADRHVSTLTVYLYSNQLTTIPNYAFQNLSAVNATKIDFSLNNNKISSIDRYAFRGVENITTILRLQNNNLTSIPAALYNHPALKELYIQDNPIKALGFSTQSQIENTLEVLNIDLNEFASWPDELSSFKELKSLTLNNLNFQHINSEAFQRFENSLTSLDMQHASYFDKVPNVVCHLLNLQTLTIKYFSKLDKNTTSLFDHCTRRLSKLTSLNLDNNKLTHFPDVFHIFPTVTSLYLYVNNLEIIESEIIPSNTILTHIDLDSNRFKRIPNALNKMKRLGNLDLRRNDIVSVEDHDLSGLLSLQTLILLNNPIIYVSTNAFRNNKALSSLYLSGTNLKTIPAAVMSLPQLSYFDIPPIPCSCEMSYLKNWNVTAVRSFNVQCSSSGTDIQSFILTSLQHCS